MFQLPERGILAKWVPTLCSEHEGLTCSDLVNISKWCICQVDEHVWSTSLKHVLGKDCYFLYWTRRFFVCSTLFYDLVSSCHIGGWSLWARVRGPFGMSLGCLLINWWDCFEWHEKILHLSPEGECVALKCTCILWPVENRRLRWWLNLLFDKKIKKISSQLLE